MIVNNWIEGAIDGFFFEISRGATVAGNVFVRCDKGVRVLNSADVHVYNNTFVDTPASFERNERSATGDHFGWHPATGPDVDQREGHVFVNNLLVASEAYREPLLQFEQPKALCAKLPRPQAKEVDGNVYVRAARRARLPLPLIVWSPAATDSCATTLGSLDEFRKLVPAFEAGGRQLDRTPRVDLQGPGPRPVRTAAGASGTPEPLPADVRKLLGWTEEQATTPGAYPFRR